LFFFFSSRRRHTRCLSDWSSDVCSSDLTFIARRNGYALGMNRDEKLTRAAGLPPRLTHLKGRAVLAPSEPSGGTWIGVNDAGARSEERRVGKECRARWAAEEWKKR